MPTREHYTSEYVNQLRINYETKIKILEESKHELYKIENTIDKLRTENAELLGVIKKSKQFIIDLEQSNNKLTEELHLERRKKNTHEKTIGKIVCEALTKDEESKLSYNWEGTLKLTDEECFNVYGLPTLKIKELSKLIKIDGENKRSANKKHPRRLDIFLAFLYFFTRYPTVQVISDKYNLSKTILNDNILYIINNNVNKLFKKSINNLDISGNSEESISEKHCFSTYFFESNKPETRDIALKYYSNELKKYGLYAHCLHDETTTQVIDIKFSKRKSRVPEEWKDIYYENENIRQIYD